MTQSVPKISSPCTDAGFGLRKHFKSCFVHNVLFQEPNRCVPCRGIRCHGRGGPSSWAPTLRTSPRATSATSPPRRATHRRTRRARLTRCRTSLIYLNRMKTYYWTLEVFGEKLEKWVEKSLEEAQNFDELSRKRCNRQWNFSKSAKKMQMEDKQRRNKAPKRKLGHPNCCNSSHKLPTSIYYACPTRAWWKATTRRISASWSWRNKCTGRSNSSVRLKSAFCIALSSHLIIGIYLYCPRIVHISIPVHAPLPEQLSALSTPVTDQIQLHI